MAGATGVFLSTSLDPVGQFSTYGICDGVERESLHSEDKGENVTERFASIMEVCNLTTRGWLKLTGQTLPLEFSSFHPL